MNVARHNQQFASKRSGSSTKTLPSSCQEKGSTSSVSEKIIGWLPFGSSSAPSPALIKSKTEAEGWLMPMVGRSRPSSPSGPCGRCGLGPGEVSRRRHANLCPGLSPCDEEDSETVGHRKKLTEGKKTREEKGKGKEKKTIAATAASTPNLLAGLRFRHDEAVIGRAGKMISHSQSESDDSNKQSPKSKGRKKKSRWPNVSLSFFGGGNQSDGNIGLDVKDKEFIDCKSESEESLVVVKVQDSPVHSPTRFSQSASSSQEREGSSKSKRRRDKLDLRVRIPEKPRNLPTLIRGCGGDSESDKAPSRKSSCEKQVVVLQGSEVQLSRPTTAPIFISMVGSFLKEALADAIEEPNVYIPDMEHYDPIGTPGAMPLPPTPPPYWCCPVPSAQENFFADMQGPPLGSSLEAVLNAERRRTSEASLHSTPYPSLESSPSGSWEILPSISSSLSDSWEKLSAIDLSPPLRVPKSIHSSEKSWKKPSSLTKHLPSLNSVMDFVSVLESKPILCPKPQKATPCPQNLPTPPSSPESLSSWVMCERVPLSPPPIGLGWVNIERKKRKSQKNQPGGGTEGSCFVAVKTQMASGVNELSNFPRAQEVHIRGGGKEKAVSLFGVRKIKGDPELGKKILDQPLGIMDWYFVGGNGGAKTWREFNKKIKARVDKGKQIERKKEERKAAKAKEKAEKEQSGGGCVDKLKGLFGKGKGKFGAKNETTGKAEGAKNENAGEGQGAENKKAGEGGGGAEGVSS
ncbi:hypothetical protein G7Y89_g12698 [Cudoniella acicularis]|uniref:Uncharacterized protein n=1 Tax=Cudoniella acicularis TaxID=354080 RepID=A0A8H4VYX3_9HELO|nr:hypothetical protein G7Y89_g12698 [Cudoniella acicularis]